MMSIGTRAIGGRAKSAMLMPRARRAETGRDGPEREGDRGGDRDQVAYREPGERRGERGPDVIAVVTAVGPELDRDLARCRKSARGDQIVLSGEFPEPGQCRQV